MKLYFTSEKIRPCVFKDPAQHVAYLKAYLSHSQVTLI